MINYARLLKSRFFSFAYFNNVKFFKFRFFYFVIIKMSATSSNQVASFNKYGLLLRWPKLWILILGILMIFLTLCIAGMEIGHTIYDLRRSTAFGGFILFLPFLICAIIIIITGLR